MGALMGGAYASPSLNPKRKTKSFINQNIHNHDEGQDH